jgi:hypothetical protein
MGRMTDMFEAQKDRPKSIRRQTIIDGFAAGLRQYGPWAIGVMIIGLAAFYGQEEIKAIWRDVVTRIAA